MPRKLHSPPLPSRPRPYVPSMTTGIPSPRPVRCSLHLAVVDHDAAPEELKSPGFTSHHEPLSTSETVSRVAFARSFLHVHGLFCISSRTTLVKYIFGFLASVQRSARVRSRVTNHSIVRVGTSQFACCRVPPRFFGSQVEVLSADCRR